MNVVKISFLLPSYPLAPVGGFRVIYEYANYLVSRNHDVVVIHVSAFNAPHSTPSWLAQAEEAGLRFMYRAIARSNVPVVHWQHIDKRIRMIFLGREPLEREIPDGDAIFATAWSTANNVWHYSRSKGIKCYLIQHWETWAGPENDVKATWLLPLHKVVISEWLYELGKELGATNIVHIPNAIDHNTFQILNSMETRKPSILSLYHKAEWKGVRDAVSALQLLHESHPEIPVTFFGSPKRGSDLPSWVNYVRNPSQTALVNLYNTHAIYLGASWTEGWALPPAEAMACGCAFVGTDIGGYKDYAQHHNTALLSPPRDPTVLFENLLKVVEDDDLRHSLQVNGHALIQKFTWKQSGYLLEQWLESELIES